MQLFHPVCLPFLRGFHELGARGEGGDLIILQAHQVCCLCSKYLSWSPAQSHCKHSSSSGVDNFTMSDCHVGELAV